MKTTVKLFAAIVMMFGFSMTSFSQQATMDATGNIIGGITVSVTQPLNFGSMITNATGGTKSVAIDGTSTVGGSGIVSVGGNTATHGIFKIEKGTQSIVTLEYTTFSTTLVSGANSMGLSSFSSLCTTSSSDGTGGQNITPAANSAVAISVPALIASNTIYVHLGATLTMAANQAQGAYTNPFTLTATYN